MGPSPVVIVSPDVVSKRAGSCMDVRVRSSRPVTARSVQEVGALLVRPYGAKSRVLQEQSTHVLLDLRGAPEGESGVTALPYDPRHNVVPCWGMIIYRCTRERIRLEATGRELRWTTRTLRDRCLLKCNLPAVGPIQYTPSLRESVDRSGQIEDPTRQYPDMYSSTDHS